VYEADSEYEVLVSAAEIIEIHKITGDFEIRHDWEVRQMAGDTKRQCEFTREHSRTESAKYYRTPDGSAEAFTRVDSRLMAKGLAALRQSAGAVWRILSCQGVRGESLANRTASQEARMDTDNAVAFLHDHDHEDPTQLGTIRDLMLEAATRGAWLTLTEIAVPTEFGEASISAQLRHLRKARHGRYRVEKRRRRLGESEAGRAAWLWEYQVLPPDQALPFHEGG